MSKNWTPGDEVTAANLNDQGLKVVAQSTPGMTLAVKAGVAIVDGTIVKYAGGNTPTITAPAANSRIDLITINSSGTIGVTAGSEAASPSAPAYPSDKTVLAEVYLRVGTTAIHNTDQGSHGYIYRDSRPLGAGISLIDESTGAPDAGKGIKTDANGKIDESFFYDKPYTKLGFSGDVNLGLTSTDVPLPFSTEIYDTDSMHDTTGETAIMSNFSNNQDTFNQDNTNEMLAQSFTVPAGARLLTKVELSCRAIGGTGSDTIKIAIRAVRTGPDLYESANRSVSTTGVHTQTFSGLAVPLTPGNTYYLIVKWVSGDAFSCRMSNSSVYAGGNYAFSTDGGANWTDDTTDLDCAIYYDNRPAIVIPEDGLYLVNANIFSKTASATKELAIKKNGTDVCRVGALVPASSYPPLTISTIVACVAGDVITTTLNTTANGATDIEATTSTVEVVKIA